jgi:DNA-binding LacI/PurR family transcriptional regulator
MPKLVMNTLLSSIRKDLQSHYAVGDRYLSVRSAARKFGVSYLTAYTGIKVLSERGMLELKRGSGSVVRSLTDSLDCSGKRIIVLAHDRSRFFNEAFLGGVREAASEDGVSVQLVEAPVCNHRSLDFGDYILGLRADGVVALSFDNTALPFYHAMINGMDMVGNVALQELPLFPAVQTDNERHARAAAQLLVHQGYTEILVGSSMPIDYEGFRGFFSTRYRSFIEEISTRATITHLQLTSPEAMFTMENFFSSFSPAHAVFSLEMSSNHLLASQFVRFGIPLRRSNFIIFDNLTDLFTHEGLQPMPTIGPSLRTLGSACARKLIDKWKHGSFTEPLLEKI